MSSKRQRQQALNSSSMAKLMREMEHGHNLF